MHEHRKKPAVVVKCAQCGKDISCKPSAIRKFCNPKCFVEHRRHKPKKCPCCGRLFYNKSHSGVQKYCSMKCAAKAKRRPITKRCQRCGKLYETCHARRKRSRFCSRKCTDMARRKSKRPSKEQLQHLLLHSSYGEIAKLYGVGSSTIGVWAKEYGIKPTWKKIRKRFNVTVSGYIGEAYGV